MDTVVPVRTVRCPVRTVSPGLRVTRRGPLESVTSGVQIREAKDQYKRNLEQKLQNNSMKEVWDRMKIITRCSLKWGDTIEGDVERANQLNSFFNRFDHPNSFTPHNAAPPSPSALSVPPRYQPQHRGE